VLASSIDWILVISGVVTAAGGFVAGCIPRLFLRFAFGIDDADDPTMFFVRHWGVLIFVVGALIVYSAYAPAIRAAALTAASIEKLAVVGLILFGPLERKALMTAIATIDGLFAIVYIAYLAGL
jgi:hypothetical protein